jgi:hypothetical protein
MSESLEAKRDQHGIFRHPSGLPLVVIFDSRTVEDKAPQISWREAFVTSSSDGPKDGKKLLRITVSFQSNIVVPGVSRTQQKRKPISNHSNL